MLTPERWEAVERIFHDALAYAPSKRTQFIDSGCGDDAELKSEVESLLAESDGHSRSGIAVVVAADWAAAGQPPARSSP